MTKLAVSLAACVLSVSAALAAEGSALTAVSADSIKWVDAPPMLPKGAQVAVLEGDPNASGPFVLRLKSLAGYKIAAHSHPMDEFVTVISGNFHIGMGDKLDETKAQELKAGGYLIMPAKMNHYAWSSTETVIQIHGPGPFVLNYVNPADDPSKSQ